MDAKAKKGVHQKQALLGDIDIEVCEKCKGPVKIIACVEDLAVIEKILKHLKEKAVTHNTAQPPPSRAPSQIEFFERS